MATQDIKVVLSATDKTRAAFDSAKRNMAGLSSSAASLTRTLGFAIPALTGAGFVAMAKGAIDAADAFTDMSKRTGVAIKDLASLKLIAEQSGTDLDVVANGLQRLSVSIGEAQNGTKEYADALTRLGVTARDPKEALFQLADAVKNSTNANRTNADLQKVLSRSYAEMLPLLKEGGDGLRKAALASEDFADAMARLAPSADEFNDNLAELKQNTAGFAANLIVDLVPALNEITKAMRDAYQEGGLLKALWVGLGGAGTFLFTDELDSLQTKLRKANEDLKDYRAALADEGVGFMKYGFLSDAELVKRISEKNTEIAGYEKAIKDAQKAAQDAAAKTGGGNAPALAGRTHATDPLASFFKATDTARLKEYTALTTELLRRMANASGDTTLYVQALDEINQKFADVNGIQAMIDEQEFMAMVQEDGAKTAKEWAENLRELANVDMDRLTTLLANTDFARLKQDQEDMVLLAKAFSEGIKDADGNLRQLSESEYLDAVKNRLGLVAAETEKAKTFAEEFNLVFESAFTKGIEAAVQGTGEFSDIVKGLAADIIKLIAQLYILEPLLKSIKGGGTFTSSSSSGFSLDLGSLFSNGFGNGQNLLGDFASLFGFEQGGVMTSAGPLPLRQYAYGGIANSPQLAMFGEGSMPEAYVPLPDGRRIPVAMQGGGGQVINNITIKTDNPSNVRASRGQVLADIQNELRRAQRNT